MVLTLLEIGDQISNGFFKEETEFFLKYVFAFEVLLGLRDSFESEISVTLAPNVVKELGNCGVLYFSGRTIYITKEVF